MLFLSCGMEFLGFSAHTDLRMTVKTLQCPPTSLRGKVLELSDMISHLPAPWSCLSPSSSSLCFSHTECLAVSPPQLCACYPYFPECSFPRICMAKHICMLQVLALPHFLSEALPERYTPTPGPPDAFSFPQSSYLLTRYVIFFFSCIPYWSASPMKM